MKFKYLFKWPIYCWWRYVRK